MQIAMAFIAGLTFGVGLLLGGMTDPSRVIGFLDLAGTWNPSLAFVMTGAVCVAALAFRFARTRTRAFLGDLIRLPTAKQIDRRLVLGGMTFGIGWGLAGYCPGPAIASLALGDSKPLAFVLAMLAGMALYEVQDRYAAARQR